MCWWVLQALTIGRHDYRSRPPSGQSQVDSPPMERPSHPHRRQNAIALGGWDGMGWDDGLIDLDRLS